MLSTITSWEYLNIFDLWEVDRQYSQLIVISRYYYSSNINYDYHRLLQEMLHKDRVLCLEPTDHLNIDNVCLIDSDR